MRLTWAFGVERVTGIEPAYSAWEADILPLNYTRVVLVDQPSITAEVILGLVDASVWPPRQTRIPAPL
jgi:hypothetical protein